MNQNLLFATAGTKTYVTSEKKYLMVYSPNHAVKEAFRVLRMGRKPSPSSRSPEHRKQTPRPELFGFETPNSNMHILNLNILTLTIVAKMLKKYPDEVMVFVGNNYWFSELPKEIQDNVNNSKSTENIKHIERKLKEEAVPTCRYSFNK